MYYKIKILNIVLANSLLHNINPSTKFRFAKIALHTILQPAQY